MAAPSYVSSVSGANSTTSPKTLACGTRAVGDLVVVCAAQQNGGSGVAFTVSDNLGNTYTPASQITGAGSVRVELWYTIVTNAGSLTASVALTGGAQYTCAAAWASPQSGTTISADAASSFDDSASSASHPCAASGAIDTSADVIVFAFSSSGNSGGDTAPSGFTATQSPVALRVRLWRLESTSALTDERATWASVSNISSVGVIASFKTVGGAGGNPWYYYAQLT